MKTELDTDEERYPLQEGKPEQRQIFGKLKRYNTSTGKYDIKV